MVMRFPASSPLTTLIRSSYNLKWRPAKQTPRRGGEEKEKISEARCVVITESQHSLNSDILTSLMNPLREAWVGAGVSNLCFVKQSDATSVWISIKFPQPPHLPLREERRVDHLLLSKLCSVWAGCRGPGLNIIYFTKLYNSVFNRSINGRFYRPNKVTPPSSIRYSRGYRKGLRMSDSTVAKPALQ